MGLYEVLKAAKIGAASDVLTTLRGQQAPFTKGGSTEHEYTGAVPYTFTADGTPLLDWYIKGNTGGIGDRTANLFDGVLTVGYFMGANFKVDTSAVNYRSIRLHLESGTYTFSFEHPVRIVRTVVDNTYSENSVENVTEYTITITDDNYDIGISFRDERSSTTPWDDSPIMLNTGSTPLSYEPYGYKIPVVCGGQTTNIYTHEPLGLSNSVSATSTGVLIPTTNGSTTIDVDTTVKPSEIYIKWKG